MSAAASYILALAFISCRIQTTHQINYGVTVDYSYMKSSYTFMARTIMDGRKCGGALISDRFVATTRHCLELCPCFDEANPSNDWTRCDKICFLKLRENSDFVSDTETVHTIKTIYLPQNSGKFYKKTDFALVELASSANICTQEETEKVRCWKVSPVRLPDPLIKITEGQRVRTLGWGANQFSIGDEQSELLAQLDITVNSSNLYNFYLETNVGPNGEDPCKGDAGGPLLLRDEDLEWTLVGTLVGGGYQCENPDGSDLTSDWIKIATLVPWINSVMGADTAVDKPGINQPTIKEKTKPTTTSTIAKGSIVLKSVENTCGKKASKTLQFATSGTGVKAPFAVSIGTYIGNKFEHHCTGSLLAPGIVLSAGHCITSEYFDRESFKIRGGVQNLQSNSAVESKIRKVVFHTKWQEEGENEIYFDVSLFFLEDPFTFSPSLQPICLPTKTFPSLPNKMLGDGITTVGWGRDNNDAYGGNLTQIDVVVRSNTICNMKFNRTGRRNRLRLRVELPRLLIASQYCADNNINTGIGTCQGDSGGPSFIRKSVNGEERFVIVGVTSGGIACGGELPDFYTYVAHDEVLPWIHSAAAEDEKNLSEFNHLSDDSWVYCTDASECSSGSCAEGICLSTLTAFAARRLGPSPQCQDKKKPCFDGKMCKEASCNRYGSACWCPLSKKKRSAEEKTYVTGKPEQWDIECEHKNDCPRDWYCADQFCYAPLSFPSLAWASLSAPVVSRLGSITASGTLGTNLQDCLCLPDCTRPVCNSLNRCWCVARGWRRG